MRRINVSEQETLLCLQDLGMDEAIIQQFSNCLQAGQVEKSKKILLTHRATLLFDVHAKQDKLYCMDILLQRIKEAHNLT